MLIKDMCFSEYYGGYLVIEADELTALLDPAFGIHDDDCYALCSCYVETDGMVKFNVLSLGNSWDGPMRGLDDKNMLGFYTMQQVEDKEARLLDPDDEMIEKNQPFFDATEENVDDDILKTRHDGRLDDLRDYDYPDKVLAGLFNGRYIREFPLEIKGVRGPFLSGKIEGEPMLALPYIYDKQVHLLAIPVGAQLSEEERQEIDRMIKEMESHGLTFNGFSMRS